MKRHALGILSAAVFLGLATANPVVAQDTTKTKPDTTKKVSAGEVAMPAAAPSFAALIASVNGAATVSAKIEALADLKAEQIKFVDAKALTSDGSEKDLTAALDANKDALESLRGALQKNQLIAKAIADHPAKPAIADVIGAEVADGSVTIYYRQKQ